MKREENGTNKNEVQMTVTSTLMVNAPPSNTLEVTGPFNVYEINPAKQSDTQRTQKLSQTPFIVPPIFIQPKTKKETADTALSATESTLRESRSSYIRSIINYIDAVLTETAGSPPNSRQS